MKKPETSRAICLLWYNSLLPYAIIAWIYHLIIAQKKTRTILSRITQQNNTGFKAYFSGKKKSKKLFIIFLSIFHFQNNYTHYK